MPCKTHRTSSSTIYSTTLPRTWSCPMSTRPRLLFRTGSRSSCSRPTRPRVPAFQEFPIHSVRRSGRSIGRLRWRTAILRPRCSTLVDRTHTTILLPHHRPTNLRSINGRLDLSTTRPSSWLKRWGHIIRPRSLISRPTSTLRFMPYMRTAHQQKWRCSTL